MADGSLMSKAGPAFGHSGGLDLSGLAALFWLTLRQQCRARRLLVLAFLFMLPAILAITIRYFDSFLDNRIIRFTLAWAVLPRAPISLTGPVAAIQASRSFFEFEFGLILNLIPHALIPLAALLYASGMIQDEIEEQTLTYLLIRPLPKWGIYLAKFLATTLMTIGLAAFFTFVTYAAIYWANPTTPLTTIVTRSLIAVGLYALAIVGYNSLFGFMSLMVKRSLVAGVTYIIVFEGILASIDFAARRLTIMYYFRTLARHWLPNVNSRDWSIDLSLAPSDTSCILIVLTASAILTALAAFNFTAREFRLKTPEGS
jgi:ABC-2 type transport system permease protein